MATTYVIGAGASLHVGYPLVSCMGQQLLNFMLRYPLELYRSAARLLIQTFGESSNIEDILTELGSRIQALKDAGNLEGEANDPLGAGNLRGYLGVALREWFRKIHTQPSVTYAEFADNVVQAGDAIITFNYDDSLERELRRAEKWDISCGYGFPLGHQPRPSAMLILKLHGSINWLVSVFGGATGPGTWDVAEGSLGRHPVIHQADLEYLGYSDFSGHLYSGGGAFPCLILPGRKKQFFYDTSVGNEFSAFWSDLWSQATQALQRNEKLVLCGYSLLPVDQDSRDLLLTAPRKTTNITIVSGDQNERIASDFRAAGFQDVNVFPGGCFEQWVQVESMRHEDRGTPAGLQAGRARTVGQGQTARF